MDLGLGCTSLAPGQDTNGNQETRRCFPTDLHPSYRRRFFAPLLWGGYNPPAGRHVVSIHAGAAEPAASAGSL